jgi:hypothetical protein
MKTFAKDTAIYAAGDEAIALYIVKRGVVAMEIDVSVDKSNMWPIGSRKWEI